MLGLLLIYFIGRYFYNLADDFNKNKWLFTILGIVSYYVFYFLFAFLGGIIIALLSLTSILELPEIVLGLMFIPFGIFGAWLFYFLLKKNWKKSAIKTDENILDSL